MRWVFISAEHTLHQLFIHSTCFAFRDGQVHCKEGFIGESCGDFVSLLLNWSHKEYPSGFVVASSHCSFTPCIPARNIITRGLFSFWWWYYFIWLNWSHKKLQLDLVVASIYSDPFHKMRRICNLIMRLSLAIWWWRCILTTELESQRVSLLVASIHFLCWWPDIVISRSLFLSCQW